MKTYFAEAADVLFFRDGREIQAGTEYSAGSVFPPNPVTIYGALRTAIISNAATGDFTRKGVGDSFGLDGRAKQLVGSARELGELQIARFSLAKQQGSNIERLFRIPNDVLVKKKSEPKSLTILNQTDLTKFGIKTNNPLNSMHSSWYTAQEGAFYEGVSVFVSETVFRKYLAGTLSQQDYAAFIQNNDVFAAEPRMGIVINDETRTVEDGKLFTTQFIRPKYDAAYKIGFMFDSNLEEAGIPEAIMFRLGGDGKLAHLQTLKQVIEKTDDLLDKVAASKRFKLIVTTPAIFEEGWLPDGIDGTTGIGVLAGVNVKLAGANIGRYQIISGWDLVNNRPKTAFRAVPPGSVYTFQLLSGDPASLKPFLTGASLCVNKDYQKQGLGISYLGVL